MTLTKVSKNIISVTDGTKSKPFNISLILSVTPKSNDTYHNYDMEDIQVYIPPNDQLEYPVELRKPSYFRTRTKLCNDSIKTKSLDYSKEVLEVCRQKTVTRKRARSGSNSFTIN